jgi:hypothetical protein
MEIRLTKSLVAPFIRAPREDCKAWVAGQDAEVKRREAKIMVKSTALEKVG